MKIFNRSWAIGLCILFISGSAAAQENITSGKNTFTTHCAFCHHLGSVLVGPDLTNVDKRHSIEWVSKFVKSSQTLVKSGDKDALVIFDQFKVVMPDQPDLSDKDIKNVVAYISTESSTALVEKPPLVTPFVSKANNLPLNTSNYFIISFYLMLVVLLIASMYFAISVQILKRKV